MITNFIFNVGGKDIKIRREKLEGRDHLVVPCVMITNGVHKGSDGHVLYEEQDMAESDMSWNHKPVVVYHPKKNGKNISAADPVVLTTRKIGITLNTLTGDGKQRTEVWLDEVKTRQVDKRILDKLEKGEPVEVSTGLYANREEKPGEWNGEKYQTVARKYRPDHLAILPDQVGACSIADGAGLLANELKIEPEGVQVVLNRSIQKILHTAGLLNNEMSLESTRRALAEALATKFGEPGRYWGGWIEVTYPDKVIFYDADGCYLIGYSIAEDGTVTFVGKAVKIERVRGYRTPDGKTILDNQSGVITNSSGETEMDKKPLIDALLANTGGVWKEKHRVTLEALDVEELKMLGKQPDPPPAPITNSSQKTEQPVTKPKTVEEHLADLPPEIAGLLANGLAVATARRDEIVAQLLANDNCPFDEKWLKQQEVPMLEGLLKLATPKATNPTQPIVNGTGKTPMFRTLPNTPTVNEAGHPKAEEGLPKRKPMFEKTK